MGHPRISERRDKTVSERFQCFSKVRAVAERKVSRIFEFSFRILLRFLFRIFPELLIKGLFVLFGQDQKGYPQKGSHEKLRCPHF